MEWRLSVTQLHVGNKGEPIPPGRVGGEQHRLAGPLPGRAPSSVGFPLFTHGLCCPLLLQDSIVWAGARARLLASTPDSAPYSKVR